jgi:hypothetical protein
MQLEKRLNEFVDYHINGDGECNGIVLKKYSENHNLSPEDRIDLAFMFSVTYCVESAIVLLLDRKSIEHDVEEYVRVNKSRLIFQSDRKYIRMKDSFLRCLKFYLRSRNDIRAIGKLDTIDLDKWIPAVEKYPMFGRFSAYLYLETVAWLTGAKIINAKMDWDNGATATSGLLNIYCYDDFANLFDKERKLRPPFTASEMQKMVEPILLEIEHRGGNNNITMVETSLCAYRKFFKGSRYNGFYLDRMLEEIFAMQHEFPSISSELIKIRLYCFDKKYLGEVGGWKGIRKECKKLYKEFGIIM